MRKGSFFLCSSCHRHRTMGNSESNGKKPNGGALNVEAVALVASDDVQALDAVVLDVQKPPYAIPAQAPTSTKSLESSRPRPRAKSG